MILFLLQACTTKNNAGDIEKWKQEIIDIEKEFSDLSKSKGIHEAFLTYAAEDAVLMRANKLVIGKKAIESRFAKQTGIEDVTLTWTPDFVDVASSGDLGYTYGHYTFTSKDTAGIRQSESGVFHSVWKRQADGNWRFVWD